MRDSSVLVASINNGLSLLTWGQETFAYAEGWDEKKEVYRGRRAGSAGLVTLDHGSLVIKPEAAMRQQRARQEAVQPSIQSSPEAGTIPRVGSGAGATGSTGGTTQPASPTAAPKARRFHGVVELDATRLGRDAGSIAEAVVQHLSGLMDTDVAITLEIYAEIPEGAPDHVVRIVTENCRTLRFKSYGFDDD